MLTQLEPKVIGLLLERSTKQCSAKKLYALVCENIQAMHSRNNQGIVRLNRL